MPDLTFRITGAQAVPFAACPTIAFSLQVASGAAIHSVALRCQILIEATRRHYTARERASLCDLFGESDRWSQTLRPLLWTHAAVTVSEFSGTTEVSVLIPCTFDFNVSAAKYFYGIEDGDVPLCFQFSGTVFYAAPDGTLQIDQIGWDKEAKFRLPAKTWNEMMDHYYPNSAWLCLRRDAFERLYEYKRSRGLATWEEAVESLVLSGKDALEKEAVS
ncbi:MAG TPA: DUF6084 family protein [Bryobacteraceae bacterium]|jgi:hypothetical protein|nr:DUF6084 family protein [Bryobacteraceae bacterium]